MEIGEWKLGSGNWRFGNWSLEIFWKLGSGNFLPAIRE